jgi:glycerophosphoryl diester phosphodiesterase
VCGYPGRSIHLAGRRSRPWYGPRVPEIHGHRGARALRPENTLPGLAYAISLGVDAIEFDVTLTADGGLILAHDLIVEAATILDTGPAARGDPLFPYVGKPWRSLTLEQIATLDAGDRRPPAPYEDTFTAIPGTAVPALDEVCSLVGMPGARPVTLAVELKSHPSWPDADVRELTCSALDTLARHQLTGRARILGFDWRVLRAAADRAPGVPRVALVESRTWVPGSAWLAGLDPDDTTCLATAARDAGAAWLSPPDQMTSAALVAATHEAGLRIVVWTVNEPARMTELIEMGVDGIVTDRPDLLAGLVTGRPRR